MGAIGFKPGLGRVLFSKGLKGHFPWKNESFSFY
jgi:hypothetical protein